MSVIGKTVGLSVLFFMWGCSGILSLPLDQRKVGETCSVGSECASGSCVEETCRGNSVDGTGCSNANECAGGFCNNEKCGAKALDDGETCSSSYECTGGICEGLTESDGTQGVCTRACTNECADIGGSDYACFDGVCVPEDYCENTSGIGKGPGCLGSSCTRCDDNATCASLDGTTGTGFRCSCNDGFVGDGFSCAQDNCPSPNPCQNGGTCNSEATPGEYTCVCEAGFTGVLDCATPLANSCPTENPCQNGGTCLDGKNGAGFECKCADDFEGSLCETKIDDCLSGPCLNGGTCVDGINSFTCDCLPGFTTATCAENIDDCPSVNPCQNGGTCIDGVNTFTCQCPPAGISGDRCEINVDDCSPNPCQNGGVCTDGINSYTCACPRGYALPTCSTGAVCDDDLGCAAEQFCSTTCQPDTCTPGSSRCDTTHAIVRCAANGSAEEPWLSCDGRPGLASTCTQSNPMLAQCTCEDDWDCPLYTVCEAGVCAGTGSPATCSLPAEVFSKDDLVAEISWGGTGSSTADRLAKDNDGNAAPYPEFGQVVMTPLVANLDDDNLDGLIDERDFPEIIFASFCAPSGGDRMQAHGILRAIHGGGPNKGQDYFATCSDSDPWPSATAPVDADCSCGSDADLNATSTLAVGDLDYDGVPEIVTIVTRDSGKVSGWIRIYNNKGEVISTSTTLYPLGPDGWAPAVAIANIDGVGFAEIIIGNDVFTLRKQGTAPNEILVVDQQFAGPGNQRTGHFLSYHSCVADLRDDADNASTNNADDNLEIVTGGAMYGYAQPSCATVAPADCSACDLSASTTLTDREQAWCNNEMLPLWAVDTLSNGNPDNRGGFCAIADVLGVDPVAAPGRDNPLNGVPEIVLVVSGRLRIYDSLNGTEYRDINPGVGGSGGGPPNVDDFDGDGFPEIGTAGSTAYAVIDLQADNGDGSDCSPWDDVLGASELPPGGNNVDRAVAPPSATCVTDSDCGNSTSGYACNEITKRCVCMHNGWRRTTQDGSSRATGSSVFDFNGDGAAEVIYNDECYFRVYNGLNSKVEFDKRSESRTRVEYPIVADVDNDGNAEIVFGTSNESGFCAGFGGPAPPPGGYSNGLEVWGDQRDIWVSARRIWNQHAYNVTNITESGRVPFMQPKHWQSTNGRTYNIYRSNPRTFGVAPDLTVGGVQVIASGGGCGTISDSADIAIEVKNIGDLRVGPGVIVGIYGKWGSADFVPLLNGSKQPLTITVNNTLNPGDALFLSTAYNATDNGETVVPDQINVVVDDTDLERECREDNNQADTTIADIVSGGPELNISFLPGMSCTNVRLTVGNDGTSDASGVMVRVYTGDPAQGGQSIGDFPVGQDVPQGGSVNALFNIAMPECRAFTVYAVVDPDNQIPECNDANNTAAQAITTYCCGG